MAYYFSPRFLKKFVFFKLLISKISDSFFVVQLFPTNMILPHFGMCVKYCRCFLMYRRRSMQNDRVRDTKEANHRIVNGESKELDEEFTLLNGVKAKAPGQSGTAYNDCNCRCILVYEIKSNEADKAFGGNTPKSIDFGGGSGIIKIKNVVGKEVIPVERSELFGEPNSITQIYQLKRRY